MNLYGAAKRGESISIRAIINPLGPVNCLLQAEEIDENIINLMMFKPMGILKRQMKSVSKIMSRRHSVDLLKAF